MCLILKLFVAEAKSAIATNGLLAGSFQTLGVAIQSALKWLLTTPFGQVALLTGAIAAAIALFDVVDTSVKEHEENLRKLKSEYSDIKSELDSLKDEFDTTKEKITELQSKGKLSFTEKEELDRLKAQNNEIQRSIDLLEMEEQAKSRKIGQEFVETMSKDMDSGKYHNIHGTYLGTEEEYLEKQFKSLEDLKDKQAQTQTKSEYDRIQTQIDEIEKYLSETNDEFTERVSNISYIKEPSNEEENAVNEWLDYVYDFQDKMAIAMGGQNAKTNAFNRLVDNYVFDEALQGLQDLGEQGEVTASHIAKALENPDDKLEIFIEKLVELGIIDSADNLELIAKAFNKVSEEAEKSSESMSVADSRLNMISSLNGMSEGFEELDKIYASIKDDDPFDFKLLDDKAFKDTFAGLGDVYADFIETITSNSNDIDKCKSAFNDLVTEWIDSKGILEDVTEENKNVTIALLKQMGVTNASAVVSQKLTEQKLLEKYAFNESTFETEENTKAAQENINSLIAEAEAAGITKTSIQNLIAQQTIFSNSNLSVSGKISQLKNLAIAFAGAAEAARLEAEAIRYSNMMHSEKMLAYRNGDTASIPKIEKAYTNYIYSLFSGVSGTKYDVSYGGGSISNSSSGSSSKENTEELFDWIERRIQKFQKKFDRWISKAEEAVTSDFVQKYYNQASGTLKQLMATQASAYDYYLKKANASTLSDSYKSKVKDGSIALETITNETTQEKIKEYQEYYDKANDMLDSFMESANQYYNLPLDVATKKIELFSDAISELDSTLDNTIGSKNKNKLIENQVKQQAEILSASNVAQIIAENNVKQTGKDVSAKSSYAKGQVAKGLELDLSKFTEGSDAWKLAVKYNEALEALTNARKDYNKNLQETISFERESAKSKFDNIADDYSKKIEMLDHGTTYLDNRIAEIEARGQAVNIEYYKEQIKLNNDKQEQYKLEKKALTEQLETIPKGTDEWYEAYATLQNVSSEISQCTQNTIGLNKAITESHFALFENIHTEIDRLIDEQAFLREMMSHEKMVDENGNFTEAGLTHLASLTASVYASKENEKNSKSIVERLNEMAKSGTLEDGELVFNSMEELETARENYYDKWREDIKTTRALEQEIYNAMKEQYDAQLSAVQDLIDKKKEALNAEKDLYDYQKTIGEKTKNISQIQKQLISYKGDSSEEGLAKLQKLQVQLAEAEEDLRETEYDRMMSDQQDMLDNLYEEYEEFLNKKMDDFMLIVQQGMDKAEENASTANSYIEQIKESLGYSSESGSILGVTGSIKSQVSTIVGKLTNIEQHLSGIGKTVSDDDTSNITTAPESTTSGNTKEDLSKDTQNKLKEDEKSMTTNSGSSTSSGGSSSGNNSSSSNSSSSSSSSSSTSKPKVSSIKSTLKEGSKGNDVKTLQKALNMIQNAGLKVDGIFGSGTKSALKKFQKNNKLSQDGILGNKTKAKFKEKGYARGSKYIPEDQLAWTQERGQELIYRSSDGALLTPLGKGDKVFTNRMSNRLWELAQGSLVDIPMQGIGFDNVGSDMQKYATRMRDFAENNTVVVQCEFPNVTNGASAQQMIREIQNSTKLQHALQDVTINRLGMKNSGRLGVNAIH